MESDRFDALTSRLTESLSRRRSVGLLGALGLGAGVMVPERANAKKKKCSKKKRKAGKCGKGTTTPAPSLCPASCPVCQACVDGRTCTVQPDGSACDGTGQCSAGACNPEPTCPTTGEGCDIINRFCCNGTCDTSGGGIISGMCVGTGAQGRPCKAGTDCNSGTCVAYRCQ